MFHSLTRRRGETPGWSASDRRKWSEFAVAEGLDALKAQRGELSGIRTRALTFTAFIITAAAFLVGVGLNKTTAVTRTDLFFVLAFAGSLLFLALAVFAIVLVVPAFKFRFIIQPEVLMRWEGGERAAPGYDDAIRAFADETLASMIRDNEAQLVVIRRLYLCLLVCAFLTLANWALVVWLFA